jgi:hypothetical protein
MGKFQDQKGGAGAKKPTVQKVCKNVQSQNQHLKTAPDFYAMG